MARATTASRSAASAAATPADGRAFSLRFQIGGDDVTFTAVKPGWNIPDGTHIPVVMQIGLDATVVATASR